MRYIRVLKTINTTMKKMYVFAVALSVAGAVSAQSTWTVDKTHAKLGFSITHLLISEVEGSFKKFDGTVLASKEDFTDAVITLTADVNSINTDDEQRDEHLKGEDFFEVSKFNTLSFKSTSFKKVEGKKYKLEGNLTMHGVTKPVVLDVIYNGSTVHPYSKKTVAGFKVTGAVKRSDFTVGGKYPSAVLGEEVVLNANLEIIKG
jgi:polyisoprenoid-binding protein YceI